MDITLNLNYGNDSLDVLKYALLYFDTIKMDIIFAGNFEPIISDEVLAVGQVLEEEGILTCRRYALSDVIDDLEAESLEIMLSYMNIIEGYGNEEFLNYLVEYAEDKMKMKSLLERILYSNEIKESLMNVYGKNNDERIQMRGLLLYHGMLTRTLSNIASGKAVLGNSEIIHSILGQELKQKEISRPFVTMNAMGIALPFLKDATLDDILDIRQIAKDELIELRSYIDSIHDLIDYEKLLSTGADDIQRVVEQKVSPAIRQFERKLSGIKKSAAVSFIDNIKDPRSYAPLLATLFTGKMISPTLSLAASLGLIGVKTLIKYNVDMNEIKNDPLYFTVSLRERITSISK